MPTLYAPPPSETEQKSCWYPFKGTHESKRNGSDSSTDVHKQLRSNAYRTNGKLNPVHPSMYQYNDTKTNSQPMPGLMTSSDEDSAVSEGFPQSTTTQDKPGDVTMKVLAQQQTNQNCISQQFWSDEIIEAGCVACAPTITNADPDDNNTATHKETNFSEMIASPPTPPQKQKRTIKVPSSCIRSKVKGTNDPDLSRKDRSIVEPRKSLIRRALCTKPERSAYTSSSSSRPKEISHESKQKSSLPRRVVCSNQQRSRSLPRPRRIQSCLRKPANESTPIYSSATRVNWNTEEFIEVSATADQLNQIKDLDDLSVCTRNMSLDRKNNFLRASSSSLVDNDSVLSPPPNRRPYHQQFLSQDTTSSTRDIPAQTEIIKPSPAVQSSPTTRQDIQRETISEGMPVSPPRRRPYYQHFLSLDTLSPAGVIPAQTEVTKTVAAAVQPSPTTRQDIRRETITKVMPVTPPKICSTNVEEKQQLPKVLTAEKKDISEKGSHRRKLNNGPNRKDNSGFLSVKRRSGGADKMTTSEKKAREQQYPPPRRSQSSDLGDVPYREIEISLNNSFISQISDFESPKKTRPERRRSKSVGRLRSPSSRTRKSFKESSYQGIARKDISSNVDDLYGLGKKLPTASADWRDDYKVFKSVGELQRSSPKHSPSKSARSDRINPSFKVSKKVETTTAFKEFENPDDDSVLSDLRTETGSNINAIESEFNSGGIEDGTWGEHSRHFYKSDMK